MKAVDFAVYFLLFSTCLVLVPPITFPAWNSGNGINLGTETTVLNAALSWNTQAMADNWAGWTGVGVFTNILDAALLGLKMLLIAITLFAMILFAPIGIMAALQVVFPQIPNGFYLLMGVLLTVVNAIGIIQLMSGRAFRVGE